MLQPYAPSCLPGTIETLQGQITQTCTTMSALWPVRLISVAYVSLLGRLRLASQATRCSGSSIEVI